MSTKIWNGWLFTGRDRSLANVSRLMAELRKRVEEAAKELAAAVMASRAAFIVDYRAIGKEPCVYPDNKPVKSWERPLSAAHMELIESYSKRHRDDHNPMLGKFDLDFKIVFVPAGNRLLMLTYPGYDVYLLLFKEVFPVREYHYQNQTDRPEEISAREWRRRRIAWDEAFAHESVPSVAGFTAECLGLYGVPAPDKATIRKHLPTYRERVKKFAVSLAAERYMAAERKKGNKKNNIDVWMSFQNHPDKTVMIRRASEAVAKQLPPQNKLWGLICAEGENR